jgi:ubiquinone/menaquinone biosynthesis C-methylase UbiE
MPKRCNGFGILPNKLISTMQNTKSIKEYYDQFWSKGNLKEQEKDNLRAYEQEALSYAFESLKQHFGSLKNKKVLEIGPGKGQNMLQFIRMGAKVTAIDISKNSLELSKESLKRRNALRNSTLLEMDAHSLQFKRNEFDIVFIQSTLMHLNTPRIIQQCRKVLKKNGIFLAIEPSNDNLFVRPYRLLLSRYKETRPNYLSYKQLINISKHFRRSKIKGFYLFSFASLIFRKNSFLYGLSSTVLKHAENILLSVFPLLEKKLWLYVSINIK